MNKQDSLSANILLTTEFSDVHHSIYKTKFISMLFVTGSFLLLVIYGLSFNNQFAGILGLRLTVLGSNEAFQ